MLEQTRLRLEETEFRLEEANDTIEAIRTGAIDALVVNGEEGHQVFTLKSADHTFRIFIEQMTEGAVTLNRNGIILYSNSRFAKIAGLALEKIVGQPFKRFLQNEDIEEWERLIAIAWNNNIKGELQLSAANGSGVPVLLSLKTLELQEGLSMSIILTDLSVQKQNQRLLQDKNAELEEAQRIAKHLNATLENTVDERTRALQINIEEKTRISEELKINQERLSQILETMAEGVVIYNLEGKLTYANPMAQKILGMKQLEGPVLAYDDPEWEVLWVDGTKLPVENYPVNTAIATGQPVYDYEIAVQPPEAERFYISINAAPIRNDLGQIVAGIGTFMDVTNRRKTIQQKDDFISVASHELRTPVTALKASLQLLDRVKNRPDTGMVSKLIEQANKSMNKMSVLIEDLLNSTKMTEGQLHLKKSVLKLRELVDDCCSDIRANKNYTISLEGDLDAEVFADADKLEQVIVNFVSNAVKYAPASKEIKIRIDQNGGMTRVSVIDQGPGVPKEKLPHLFDRYYRVDSSGAQYSGLGLGLYICAQIMEKHGGKIGAESEIGKGSTFWFSLPDFPDTQFPGVI